MQAKSLGKKPPKQHWLGKGVSATIPRSLCDSTPKPFSHFCNCDKHVFLAQICGFGWSRILVNMYQCLRQYQMKCPGVTRKIHMSSNPKGLPLTLISNKMNHISVEKLTYFQVCLVRPFCSLLYTFLILLSIFFLYSAPYSCITLTQH